MEMQAFVRMSGVAALAGAVLCMGGRAGAGVIFGTGNIQYTNVNIAADANAMTIQGEVGSTGVAVLFNGWSQGPSSPVMLHGQHGVAFVEAFDPADTLYRMTITAQTGYAFSAMDWKLDAAPPDDGLVTFRAFDAGGNLLPLESGTDTFFFSHNGQNPYNASVVVGSGENISMLEIQSTIPIMDLKQVSVELVPGPASLGALGLGTLLMGRRRR